METIRTYDHANARIEGNAELQALVAGHLSEIHGMLTRGMGMRWEAFSRAENRLPTGEAAQAKFVRSLAAAVAQYYDKINELLIVSEGVNKSIDSLLLRARCRSRRGWCRSRRRRPSS
eukprot:Unigene2466_Nuclearia_a/m.7609 Unigene2466_Nuclearia_a/g.7609  ORF Unigene2466_Nuclearia_a/g.7609 Unigene2466_Nuclearia_a/m.7609 type:complete len:118 (+) Unigene2466_Nuclearia_a:935-1288(+)